MSNAAINPAGTATLAPPHHDGHATNGHDPHLAHHFDTPEQQYSSAKLGMWIFLGTEVLMFGGLFCGYAVYRHNHAEVFAYADRYLDRILGGINTLVLITSSLTMAWAVRCSQLGQQRALRWLLAVTIVGGYVFLGIKGVEYRAKWEHKVFIGTHNRFRPDYKGPVEPPFEQAEAMKESESAKQAYKSLPGHADATPPPGAFPIEVKNGLPPGPGVTPPPKTPIPIDTASAEAPAPTLKNPPQTLADSGLVPPDPNTGSGDQARIRPTFAAPQGLAANVIEEHRQELVLGDLSKTEQLRLYTFFAIYFFMTGLHGIHVIVGMSLIFWVLVRAVGPRTRAWLVPMLPLSIGVFLAVVGVIIYSPRPEPGETPGNAWWVLIVAGLVITLLSVLWALWRVPRRRLASDEGEFGPTYFTPVDLSGLYWHLVDLIWIFLFPLLYLIH